MYNRSGKAQKIELPQKVSGWNSGVENQRWHTLADLDSEIYLKMEAPPIADVNRDGVVNVLDFVVVANAFGEAVPDLIVKSEDKFTVRPVVGTGLPSPYKPPCVQIITGSTIMVMVL